MSQSYSGSDGENKPREMVYRSMAQAKARLHQAGRVWNGATTLGEDSHEEARIRIRRELHASTMAYLDQIRRFRQKKWLREAWSEQIEGLEYSLEDLSERRFSTQATRVEDYDASSGREVTKTVERPWMLTIPEADAVIDRLDSAALALGFDDSPKNDNTPTGAGHNPGDEQSVEDTEFINANPLEMGANGD
jgi:hypothetical protein